MVAEQMSSVVASLYISSSQIMFYTKIARPMPRALASMAGRCPGIELDSDGTKRAIQQITVD